MADKPSQNIELFLCPNLIPNDNFILLKAMSADKLSWMLTEPQLAHLRVGLNLIKFDMIHGVSQPDDLVLCPTTC